MTTKEDLRNKFLKSNIVIELDKNTNGTQFIMIVTVEKDFEKLSVENYFQIRYSNGHIRFFFTLDEAIEAWV